MQGKIVINKEAKGSISIPRTKGLSRSYKELNTVKLYAGHLECNATIKYNDALRDGVIILSQDIAENLHMPGDITCQIRVVEGGLRLGPVIGLLLANGKRSMASIKPSDLMSYTAAYPQVGGLLLVFCVEGINYEDKTVKGFYYKSEASKGDVSWEEATLPFPDAIFRRTAMSDRDSTRLREVTSNRMFNSLYFNKWDFWNMISRNKTVREFLPFTKLYKSMDDVDDMIKKYNCAYLKPINGTLSRGLIRVTRENGEYQFQLKEGDVPPKGDRGEAEEFIKNSTHGRKYLIQQSINPMRVDGRHTDFRVIMQKNHTKKWDCTGIIAFIGRPNQICSNWGYEMTFEDLMTRHFNMSQKDIFKKRQEIVNACKQVCNALDESGENLGDLGFDVILDGNMKIWILEANKKHYHTVPLWIKDEQTYYTLKANIIKYAAALAGF